jgi:undecaprenyl-diphosphatase
MMRMAIAFALIFVLTEFIRYIYHHPRPLLALKTPHLFEVFSNSFPSGHTIFIIGLATVFYYTNRKFSYFLFASGILVGITRVIAGVHYPLDIAGGIALGIGMGMIAHSISLYLFPPRKMI